MEEELLQAGRVKANKERLQITNEKLIPNFRFVSGAALEHEEIETGGERDPNITREERKKEALHFEQVFIFQAFCLI